MSSNADSAAKVQELLKKLWEQHKETIFERLAALEKASAQAIQLDTPAIEEARSAAHKLAGSLGTFGFRQGSDWAKDSEQIFIRQTITAADQQQLIENARNIRSLIESPHRD